MSGAIHPLPQYTFMVWCSVKAQGQLYLYLYLFTDELYKMWKEVYVVYFKEVLLQKLSQ
jgi:hypothetical protein